MSTETAANVGQGMTFTGAAGAVGGWMTANDFAAWAGAAAAIIGLVVTIVFKLRADQRDAAAERREVEEHAARMDLYRQGIDPRG